MIRTLLVFAALGKVLPLRMQDLAVPASVMKGEPLWLNCTFDLERDELYSIKWYKNNVEFYRYLPSDNPPAQKYILRGINLDMNRSWQGHIYMSRSDLNSEGTYRCEVSAEAPSFQTIRDEKELRIYVLPDKGPMIIGSKARYRIGETVNVTCVAAPSRPAAFLQWLLNDQEVSPYFLTRPPPIKSPDGLLTARAILKFQIEPTHFWDGLMKLKCVAFVSKAYSVSRSEIVATNKDKATNMQSVMNSEGPAIIGGRAKYQVGSVVNVNCTAPKARPPAELRWYINDKEPHHDFLKSSPPLLFPDGKESTVLGMRFTVRNRHFQRGEMRLKCTSTLYKVINTSSEELTIDNRQQSSGLHLSENNAAVFSAGSAVAEELLTLVATLLLLCSR